MNVKNTFRAAALAAALAFAASGWAQPAATQPATQPAGNGALVTSALAPPRAQTEPATEPGPVVPQLQPAKDPAAARADKLLRKLLNGPPDASALSDLIELRNRLLQRDADALSAIACGLRLYLDIGPQLAAGPLDKAMGNPNVSSLAAALPTPLAKIAGECRAAALPARRGTPAGEAARVCLRCGDTHLAPCSRCNGSGYVPCPKCGGAGVLRGSDSDGTVRILGLCPQCNGAGVVACQTCGGTGSVECTACKPKPSQAAALLLPAAEVREIRKVVCKARWIRAGGIDLYTKDAREPSPK